MNVNAELLTDQPILNIAEEWNCWKEDAGKILIGGFEEQGKAWAKDDIPANFEFDEIPFDMEPVEEDLMHMFARYGHIRDERLPDRKRISPFRPRH